MDRKTNDKKQTHNDKKQTHLYIVCPSCGYKLLKAGNGSTIEIHCPKCGAKMLIEIKDGKIVIQKVVSDRTT